MSGTRRNVMVGAFVLVGLAAAGALMAMFGEQPTWFGGAEYELAIRIGYVTGVEEGTPINMNGVEVGRVGRLEFRDPKRPDRGVSVVALIKNRYIVPQGTSAKIYVSPIGLGRTRIELLVPGADSPPLPQVGAIIPGEMANVLEDIVSPTMLSTLERTARQIGDFAEELTPVAADLHQILERRPLADVDQPDAEMRHITANLYTAIQRFDQTLKHFNDVLGDPEVQSGLRNFVTNMETVSEDAKTTFATLRDTSAELRTDVDRISGKFEGAVDKASLRIDTIGDAVMPVLDNSAALTATLNQAAQSLAEGDGTAGRLLRDARLYETMLITLERVQDLVETLGRLADKFERQGYVEFKAHTAIGPVKDRREIPAVAAGSPSQ
jgi:phospholipid/cholesterol/gamma-HCH transport system substrate-binding protein